MLDVFDVILIVLCVVAGVLIWHLYKDRKSHVEAARNELRSDYFKGINYVLNEQPDKAIEVFIKLLEVDSETVETHLALGNLYRRRGEVDRAIRIHQNLVARENLTDNQRNEALLELGQDYLNAGLLDRAEDIFNELKHIDECKVQSLRQLIDIYEQEKEWDRSIDTSYELESLTGDSLNHVIAQYYCEIAQLAYQNKEKEEALKLVRTALQKDIKCIRASLLEGSYLAEKGDHEGSIRAFKRIESQDPDFMAEAVDRIHEQYKKIRREPDMVKYLKSLIGRIGGRSSTIIEMTKIKRDNSGNQAAIEFIAERLKHRVSLRGLETLIQLELNQPHEKDVKYLNIFDELTRELLADRPAYRCSHCGFKGKLLHWQCPGCKNWASTRPIIGIEGE